MLRLSIGIKKQLTAHKNPIGIVIASFFIISSIFVAGSDTYEAMSNMITGSISGHVYQSSGDPIFGATIELIRQDEGGDWEATSDIDGKYYISDLPNGYYKIRAFKQDYAREYYDNVFFSNEATIISLTGDITDIDFSLTLGGSIAGKVYDEDTHQPIRNAEVKVIPGNQFSDDGFWTRTDANGEYFVEGLALGLYCLQILTANEYVDEWYNNEYFWETATRIKVVPPDTTEDIDIGLILGGSVSGHVYDSDGVTPITGIAIIADGDYPFGTDVLADGSYQIEGMLPGAYTLRTGENMPGWYAGEFYDSKFNQRDADLVMVTAGEAISNIDFTLVEGGIITGYVYDEETGKPIDGCHIHGHTLDGIGVTPLPWTTYDGKYRYNLREGKYLIKVGYAHGYVPEWFEDCYDIDDAFPVEVIAYEETSDINFYLSSAGSISGFVKDTNGDPLRDASVFAFSEEFTGSGTLTKEDGSYTIDHLPSGDYYVQVTLLGYISEYFDDTTSQDDATLVSVLAPDDSPGINFYLTPGDTQPPNKPTIDGPAGGSIGEEYTYTSSTTDPDDDQIYYLYDWGDGTDSGWFGPFISGEEISSSHAWTGKGSYEIKVKAKDIYGVQSVWSDPLEVSMPKNRVYTSLYRFLENHPMILQLLQKVFAD